MPHKPAAERRTLLISAAVNLIVGAVGLVFSFISASQAILLDGLFNLTYLAVGLFTLRIARLVQRGDDKRFPYGYGFFEPLINGIKGVLVLGISALALADAVYVIVNGGREIAAGAAVGYGVFASAACWTAAYFVHRGARASGSPLADADARNWIINAAVSSCVLLAFGMIMIIRGTRLDPLVPYVDPGIVVGVVLLSISVPVRMAWRALMELVNRAPAPEIVEGVERIVRECLAGEPVQELFVRVVQPGRTRIVAVHVVLPGDFEVRSVRVLDALREKTVHRLKQEHDETILDICFTADRRWGAPLSEGGQI